MRRSAASTATTVTITDLGAIVPPGSIPGSRRPWTASVSFSIAAEDRVVFLTVGDGAIEEVLAVPPAPASPTARVQAGRRARPPEQPDHRLYLAVGAAVDFVEPFMPARSSPQWTTDIKPYVDPLEAVAAAHQRWTMLRTRSRSRPRALSSPPQPTNRRSPWPFEFD